MKGFLTVPLLLLAGSLHAEIHRMPERMDYPLEVDASVSFDPATHMYTYHYVVTNLAGNPRPVDYFSIIVQPGVDVITEVASPKDWEGAFSEHNGVVDWAGTNVAPYIPADYVHDGHSIPPYGPWIKPGEKMGGFSFKSFSPPGAGQGISQTFAPIPWADDAEELMDLPYNSNLPEENGYRFSTTVPVPDADWSGNRRPSVDGFLVFANTENRTSFAGSALIVLRFAVGGEKVDMSTFRATLNSESVTGRFVYDATYKGYAARFTPENSPLRAGNNVLLTSIDGTIPGVYDRPVNDSDRLSFDFKK